MNEWMEGYTSDIEYTAGYYKELSPDFLNVCALMANVQPIPTNEPFTYCELGCGQGLTILIQAANYPKGTFYAVDYNPSHIAHARAIAKEANLTNIYFLEKSFQELVENPTLLPEVDFMIFHGIYTWVNDENRSNLINLCQRHVVSGGLVYNSYNAKPGWLAGEPIQKLVWGLSKEHHGSSLEKIEKIIETLDELKDLGTGYFELHKEAIKNRLDSMKKSDKNYVVHEYLHESWRAFYFPEVSEDMAKAKLNYLCLAQPGEAFMQNVLPEKLREKLATLHDRDNREFIKDLALNTGFRKDIYSRGVRKQLDAYEKNVWFINQQWLLLKRDIPEKFQFSLSVGKVTGDEKTYRPIVDHLRQGVLTTQELQRATGLQLDPLIQALVILYGDGAIAIYKKNTPHKAQELNKIIAKNAFENNGFKFIALPNINSAIPQDSTNLTWLSGIYAGYTTKDALVNHVYHTLSSRGLSVVYKGEKLTGDSMKKRLYQIEEKWRKEMLPLWQQVGVVPSKIKGSKR